MTTAWRIRRPVDVPAADRSVFRITMELKIAYECKIMRENDDLTLPRLSHQAFGNAVTPLMVQRRNRVIED